MNLCICCLIRTQRISRKSWYVMCHAGLSGAVRIWKLPAIHATKSSVSMPSRPLLTSPGWVRWKFLTEYTLSFLCSNILAQGQNNYSILLINGSPYELANALGYGKLHGLKLNNSASFKQNNIGWACDVESPMLHGQTMSFFKVPWRRCDCRK